MKTKHCTKCRQPFRVVERGDDPRQLERGVVHLAAAAKVCLECHRKSEAPASRCAPTCTDPD